MQLPRHLHRLARRQAFTLGYLGATSLTTAALRALPPRKAKRLQRTASTNIDNLAAGRVHTLVTSATVAPDLALWPLAPTAVVLGATELWLGTRRVAVVAAAGHGVATGMVAGGLVVGLRLGLVGRSVRRAVDVGPSYAATAAAAVLGYRLPRPVRLTYHGTLGAAVAVRVVRPGTFTDWGHAAAFGVGLALRPLTR